MDNRQGNQKRYHCNVLCKAHILPSALYIFHLGGYNNAHLSVWHPLFYNFVRSFCIDRLYHSSSVVDVAVANTVVCSICIVGNAVVGLCQLHMRYFVLLHNGRLGIIQSQGYRYSFPIRLANSIGVFPCLGGKAFAVLPLCRPQPKPRFDTAWQIFPNSKLAVYWLILCLVDSFGRPSLATVQQSQQKSNSTRGLTV